MNIENIRKEFPQINTIINGQPLVYFDNAATTLKPQIVINAITQYYSHRVANVHRGVHSLSEAGTREFEDTRIAVKELINAKESCEIIFTKGTTESLNLLAHSFGKTFLKAGDEILLSLMEHHSNIVPWQMVAEATGAVIKVVPINSLGELDLNAYKSLLTTKTKIVSISHISNTLGTINPIKSMIKEAHNVGAKFCVDAAQSIGHFKIDVQDLNCDFLAFSAHKLYGPNGVGVLYGKEDLLNIMPPYQGGGAMISEVRFEKTTYHNLPNKFEAGTPVIAEIIAFKSAINYVLEIGFDNITKIEKELLSYATIEIKKIEGIKILGISAEKSAVLSFVIDGIHPHDLGTLLDKQGVAIRTGHHCTQPLLQYFGATAAARASFAFYNTKEEIDIFIKALKKACELLK